MRQEEGEKGIKDNSDFELRGPYARAERRKCRRGPSPPQGSGVAYSLHPAVHVPLHEAHVEMRYRWLDMGNKI